MPKGIDEDEYREAVAIADVREESYGTRHETG
jgi:hypothetical protein